MGVFFTNNKSLFFFDQWGKRIVLKEINSFLLKNFSLITFLDIKEVKWYDCWNSYLIMFFSELAVQQGPGVSLETNLPEFSFSPQEYITQTGEYLMTLPQHLEPFMSGEWNLLFILLFLVLLETPLFYLVCKD